MKIMIPYDGLKDTKIALSALRRPADFAIQRHEALVVVSEVWLPESREEFSYAVTARRRKTAMSGISSNAPALRALEEKHVLSREAREQITSMFPLWEVSVETLPGFNLVSSKILEKAERSRPDFIVIGWRDIFAGEVTGYGAGALRVAKESGCNVFLARDAGFAGSNTEPNENHYARIIVILDGTDAEIGQTIARRRWKRNSEARITTIEAKGSPITKTRTAGLSVSLMKPENNWQFALVQAVFGWNPDCIF